MSFLQSLGSSTECGSGRDADIVDIFVLTSIFRFQPQMKLV